MAYVCGCHGLPTNKELESLRERESRKGGSNFAAMYIINIACMHYKPKTKCHINLRVVRPQASGHIISFVYFNFLEAQVSSSVGKRIREGRRRKADLLVGRVEHRIEPLQEREPVDEIEPLALVVADVPDDQIHIVRCTADVRVDRPRPRLRVRRELEGCLNFSK